jgi:hypothetical protein
MPGREDAKAFEDISLFVVVPVRSIFKECLAPLWVSAIQSLQTPPRVRVNWQYHAILDIARNAGLREFLEAKTIDGEPYEFLMLIDSDNCPLDPKGLRYMYELWCEHDEYDVISGLYFAKEATRNYMPMAYEVAIQKKDDATNITTTQLKDVDFEHHRKIGATGAGCMLVPRYVVEAIEPTKTSRAPFLFLTDYSRGYLQREDNGWFCMGEDIHFCWQVLKAGFKIGLTRDPNVGHFTEGGIITEETFMSHKRRIEHEGGKIEDKLRMQKDDFLIK